MASKNYNVGIAFLKIWMCYEVVLDHFYYFDEGKISEYRLIKRILYEYGSFAVPIFMISSLALLDYKTIASNKQLVKKRIIRLTGPHLFWALVYFAFFFFWGEITGTRIVNGIADIIWQVTFGHCYNQATWFQVVLILLTLFILLLVRFFRKGVVVIAFVITYISLIIQYREFGVAFFKSIDWPKEVLGTYFSNYYVEFTLGRLIEMVPYMTIGIMIPVMIRKVTNKSVVIIIAIVSMICFFVNEPVFNSIEGYGYQGGKLIILASLSFVLFFLLPFQALPEKVKQLIVGISKHTMGIYYVHNLVGFICYHSALVQFLRMREKSVYDCCVIFLISLTVSVLGSKVPLKMIREAMS